MTRLKSGFTMMMVILFLLFNVSLAWAEGEGILFDHSGTLDASAISQTNNQDSLLPLPPVATQGSSISLRSDLQIIPNDQLKVKLRLSYLTNSIDDSPQNNTLILSRGFIDYTPSDSLSVRLGKQRLAWGTGYAWNPTNILDQPRNAFTSIDDPEGINALRTDLIFGPVTGQLVVTSGDSWDSSGKAVRIKTAPGGLDLTLGWVQPETGGSAVTADVAYSLAGIGLHGEAVYQSEGNIRTDKEDILNYLLGMDYNFPGGYYIALEYYHNDTAFENIQQALFYLGTHPGLDEQEFLTNIANNGGVTRDHYFLRCAKSFGENTNIEILLVHNATDASYVGQPKIEYTWKQNTTFYLKGLLTEGAVDSEVNLLPIDGRWDLGVKVSF